MPCGAPCRSGRSASSCGTARPLDSTDGGPTFSLRSPQALGHVLRSPGQLGVGRAYVSGALDVDDVEAALALLDSWSPPPVDPRDRARIAAAAVRAGALRSVPHVPDAELRPRGRRHSVARDRRSVRHHYDVSNAFFELFLGESMTYSCAIFSRGATTLEEAQEAKLEMVCTKLALEPGMRVLDVGCGWGSFAVHAATRHGVHVTGITLSEPQAERARERARAAGVADKVDIRVQDYRELGAERFDRVASIGMVEHVGAVNIDAYAQHVVDALEPGGVLLNHGIARLRHGDPEAGAFSERFVFPDAAPLHLSRIDLRVREDRRHDRPRRGLRARLRGDAAPLGCAARRAPRRRDPPRRPRARARVAALPAGRAARLRVRLHVGLPGQSARLIAAATRFAPGAPSRIE